MFKWLFRLAVFGVVLVLLVPGNETERRLVVSALASAAYKTLTFCQHNQQYCHQSLSKVTGFAGSFASYLKQHSTGLPDRNPDVRLEPFEHSQLESGRQRGQVSDYDDNDGQDARQMAYDHNL